MVKMAQVWLVMYIWIANIIFPQKMASGAALVLLVLLTLKIWPWSPLPSHLWTTDGKKNT